MRIFILNHYEAKYHKLYCSHYFTSKEKAESYLEKLIAKYNLSEDDDEFEIVERKLNPDCD